MTASAAGTSAARATGRDRLRWAPVVTTAAFLLPIGAGLVGTVLPAFGYLPAIGGDRLSLAPWRELFAYPGFATSLRLTLFTGIVTTTLALLLAIGLMAFAYGRPWMRRLGTLLAPLLATPHSALAIGFVFLIAPSGWLVRLVSPGLTGWATPPDFATAGDSFGLALVCGLLLKEVPFLALMIQGALHQIPAERHLNAARSVGYSRAAAWIKVILPQIYPQVRLPIYAVLAFSLSVVDVALILGPGNPPTLAVLAVRWFTDADIRFYFPAAAAACLQLAIVVAAIGAWRALERIAARAGRAWIARGRRDGVVARAAAATSAASALLYVLAIASLLGLALWSFASQWRYPDALPHAWTIANWMRQARSLEWPTFNTLAVGSAAVAVALVLTLACLEHEARMPRPVGRRILWVLYVPLLVPQIAFLFGMQVILVRLGIDGTLPAVTWIHLVYVLPYLFLSLSDPWRAFDGRYVRSARSLGASRWRTFFRIRVPILLRPILIACAVAFAVSVGQYLTTLFAGNGRVATLTTEAVTLSSGADRRVIGTWALMQAALPLVGFVVAGMLPMLLYANRRGVGR